MKLISMCLYGQNDMYIDGAIENVRLAKEYYPDWKMRIYVSDDVDTSRLHCECVKMGASLEHSGMFWRFLPIWEEGVERVIVRDVDSRLNAKEAAAVQEWIDFDTVGHSMHDHEHHRCFPLFGGMFGVKSNMIQDNSQLLADEMNKIQPRVADMRFLSKYVWPYIKDDTLHHSSVQLQWAYRPFPDVKHDGFIGQQHGVDGAICPGT